MDRIIPNKIESRSVEQGIEKEPLRLEDYIKAKSNLVMPKEEMLERKIKPHKNVATLSYYNEKSVKFNVRGYNMMYVDESGDLRRVFIRPDSVADLSRASQLREREEIEKRLEEFGYKIDDSDNFKNILDKITK
jgi:ribosomal protein L32E